MAIIASLIFFTQQHKRCNPRFSLRISKAVKVGKKKGWLFKRQCCKSRQEERDWLFFFKINARAKTKEKLELLSRKIESELNATLKAGNMLAPNFSLKKM